MFSPAARRNVNYRGPALVAFATFALCACGDAEAVFTNDRQSPNDAGPAGNGSSENFGGSRGEHYDEAAASVDQLLEFGVAYAEFFCECEENATSGENFDACVARYVIPYPPPLLACTKNVYSRSDGALEALQCEEAFISEYIACLQASTCTDFDHITECETDRILSQIECPDMPYAVFAEDQESCYGRELPAPFECDDGEKIDPDLVCDLRTDCGDGSDEDQDCTDPHAGLDL